MGFLGRFCSRASQVQPLGFSFNLGRAATSTSAAGSKDPADFHCCAALWAAWLTGDINSALASAICSLGCMSPPQHIEATGSSDVFPTSPLQLSTCTDVQTFDVLQAVSRRYPRIQIAGSRRPHGWRHHHHLSTPPIQKRHKASICSHPPDVQPDMPASNKIQSLQSPPVTPTFPSPSPHLRSARPGPPLHPPTLVPDYICVPLLHAPGDSWAHVILNGVKRSTYPAEDLSRNIPPTRPSGSQAGQRLDVYIPGPVDKDVR